MTEIEQPTYWLFAINLILITVAVIHMLYQKRSPQSLSTWLLAILLLPIIGVVIYFIFGLRKSYSKRYKARITQKPIIQLDKTLGIKADIDLILNSNRIAGSSEHNQIEMIDDDVQAYKTLIELIEQSQKQISIETYIFEVDKTGQAIIDALINKAKQGVEVRLLLDAIGSFSLYLNSKPLAELKKTGGQVAFFQPIWPNIITNQINLRNHRKIYLFDQQTLLTGGLNLSDDYLGETEQSRWLDLLFQIQGPACFHYQYIFNEDWFYTTKEKLSPANISAANEGSEVLQAIPSGPDIESDTLYEVLLHAIYQAKEEIRIASPYFIPNNNVMNALLIAIKRGIKVILLTPEKSDHWIFDFGRSSYTRELIEAGGEAYYYPHKMMHAKLILIDRELAISGSANLDYRSLFLNYEMVHTIYCQTTLDKLIQWFTTHQKMGTLYKPPPSRLTRFIENMSRIIAPIL